MCGVSVTVGSGGPEWDSVFVRVDLELFFAYLRKVTGLFTLVLQVADVFLLRLVCSGLWKALFSSRFHVINNICSVASLRAALNIFDWLSVINK